jgi:hypothetical protein
MMMRVTLCQRAFRLLAAAGLMLALAACSEIETLFDFSGNGSCSRYNGALDRFQMGIDENYLALNVGDTRELTVERSWLNINLERRTLQCALAWSSNPPGVVTAEGTTVEALAPGTTELTATVTGDGGTVRDSVYILVRPPITEVEPNNGPVNANPLPSGVSVTGRSDYANDQDWFLVTLPPGAGMQVTMTPSLANPGNVWSYNYAGAIRDRAGNFLANVNRTYENEGPTTQEVFVVIDGSGAIPYRVRVDVYTP